MSHIRYYYTIIVIQYRRSCDSVNESLLIYTCVYLYNNYYSSIIVWQTRVHLHNNNAYVNEPKYNFITCWDNTIIILYFLWQSVQRLIYVTLISAHFYNSLSSWYVYKQYIYSFGVITNRDVANEYYIITHLKIVDGRLLIQRYRRAGHRSRDRRPKCIVTQYDSAPEPSEAAATNRPSDCVPFPNLCGHG